MAKKFGWPWIAGALFVAWIVGSNNESSTTQPEFAQRQSLQNNTAPNSSRLARSKSAPSLQSITMYVDSSRLNVRSGPTKTANQVWTLKNDEQVTVIEKSGDWLRVKSNRYDGWVYGTYLTPKKSPSKPQRSAQERIAAKPQLSTAAIKKTLIARSIAYYSGSCPCPYNRTRSGRRCGGNSAYSRPGGASPLCFERDVSARMVSEYRARQ